MAAWAPVLLGLMVAGASGAETPAPTPAPAASPPAPPKPLDILEFVVDGNTVLDEASIDEALEPYMGPGRTTGDVDQGRAALEQVYKDRGYKTVAVTIPRQTGADGVIHLAVVEGRVRLLTVEGSRYHSIDQIAAETPSLAEGTVPDFGDVQKDLVAVNQQPDRKITPALKPGPTPGSIDVVLSVDDSLPVHGNLEVNNRRSQNTSELRTLGSLSYDNLWQRGHSLTLTFQTAPQHTDDAKVGFASYFMRFPGTPYSLLFDAIKTDSDVATVGGTNVVGKGETYGVKGYMNLPSEEGVYRSLSLGVDYKRFNTLTDFGGSGFSTPVTYYPVTLGYTWLRRGEAGNEVGANLGGTFASTLSGHASAALDDNRLRARSGLFYLRGDVSTTRQLPLGVSWTAKAGGQWTESPLITNEEFSAGGADSVRGYLESEALGDYAFTFTTELRAPSLANRLAFGRSHVFDEFQPFIFFDSAELRVHDAQPEQADSFSLASTGAGLNFKMLAFLDGTVDWASAILNGPVTDKGTSRVLFRLRGSF